MKIKHEEGFGRGNSVNVQYIKVHAIMLRQQNVMPNCEVEQALRIESSFFLPFCLNTFELTLITLMAVPKK